MAQVDLAGSVPAQERAQGPVVTLAVNSFLFKEPVFVGDLVSFYAGVTKVGRASITVDGEVFAQRGRVGRSEAVKVTEAQLTYVAIDAQRHPRPVPAAVVEERAGNDWKQAISESIPLGARPCGRRGGRSPAAGMLSASGEPGRTLPFAFRDHARRGRRSRPRNRASRGEQGEGRQALRPRAALRDVRHGVIGEGDEDAARPVGLGRAALGG